MKRCWSLEAILLLVGVTVVVWLAVQRSGGWPDWLRGGEEIAVQAVRARRTLQPVVLALSGELQPIRQIDVVSRLAGRLTELRFKVGDNVAAGAVVATVHASGLALRTGAVERALGAARADYQEKAAQFAALEKQLAKTRELFKQDLIARRDAEQAELAASTARAQLDLAAAQVAQQEAMLQQSRQVETLARLVTPIGGVVLRRLLEPGAQVDESRAVLTIAQLDPLKLSAEVSGPYAGQIRPGMAVRLSNRAGSTALRDGKIALIESRTFDQQPVLRLEIHLANRDGALEPGMVVDGALTLEKQEPVLVLPRSAIQTIGERHFIYRIADRRALRQEIKIADTLGDDVVVRAGLSDQSEIIRAPLESLKDGARVRIIMVQDAPQGR